ncbi:MAG: motility protein A [Candidatus Marinimicrobia bacterium]|nr:motility protein A [Candidatus Neomarinimicrobiota bacterium]
MDFSTIVGLITGVAMIIIAIIDSGGGVDIFTSGSAYLIVIGGTLAATFVNFPFKAVISSFKSATNVFSSEEIQEIYLIDEIVNLGKIKREKGVFGLEKEMKNIQNPFLKNAIELSLGGDKKERLESHLMLELKNSEKRDNNATEIFYQMGEYAPAFGMIGTVIGLIVMLGSGFTNESVGSSIGDKYFELLRGMGLALKTTLYGIIISNLIFLPIAGKLGRRSKDRLESREMIVEGALSIHQNDHPIKIREKLEAYISEEDRKGS